MPCNPNKKRCLALTGAGRPCRAWAQRGHPYCHLHDEEARPQGKRRCTALTPGGARCRNWSVTGTALCATHAGRVRLPGPADSRRCSATAKSGALCPHWARKDSRRRFGRALCPVHSRAVHWRPSGPGAHRCSATTLHGTGCRHWAQPHTEPPLCWTHSHPDRHGGLRHGYYRRRPYLPDTLRATVLELAAEGEPLAAEIAVMRLKIVALLAYLGQPELPMRRWLPAYRLVLQAVRTVAALLRAQQGLDYEGPGRVPSLVHGEMSKTTGGYLPVLMSQLAAPEDGDDGP